MLWLFKHPPQSGSKGHLSQALTFTRSISLLCCCIALAAPPAVCVFVLNERRCVLWADLDCLFDNIFKCGKKAYIYQFVCERLSVCVRVKCIIPLHMHARAHAGCHFLYLGESECGSQSTYTLLGNVWTATPHRTPPTYPTPPPDFPLCFTVCCPGVKLIEIKFSVPFSIIQQLDQVQSFLFTGNRADVTRRMFVFQLQFCRCFKTVVHEILHEHNRGKKGK